jgi:uncharacterized membrane protein
MVGEAQAGSAGASMPLTRIETFSDGVFAIIVTLLVLEIKTPDIRASANIAGALQSSLLLLLPKVAGYVISFITVAIFWVNHHQLFHSLKYSDRRLLWINNALLMFLAFVPFPTGVLGEYPNQPIAVSIYGLVLCLSATTMSLMRRYAIAAGLHRDLPESILKAAIRKSSVGPILYLVGMGLGWFFPLAGIGIYAAIALFYFLPAPGQGSE